MPDILKVDGVECGQGMFWLPVGFVDELELLLYSEEDGHGHSRSRRATQDLFDRIVASMSLDELPWGADPGKAPSMPSMGGCVGSTRKRGRDGTINVFCDSGHHGAFYEIEGKLAVDCANALNDGRKFPRWGAKRVPASVRRSGSSKKPGVQTWWDFKYFKPFAAVHWLAYPVEVHSRYSRVTKPGWEAAKGAAELPAIAASLAAALPWIKAASGLYKKHVFPMLAHAAGISKQTTREAGLIPAGKLAVIPERDALMAKIGAVEGYAVYCDGSNGRDVGFLGTGVGFLSPSAWGCSAGAAATFATAQEASDSALARCVCVYAVVKLGVQVIGVQGRSGGVDVSLPEEIAARRERLEMEVACVPSHDEIGSPRGGAQAARL